MSKSEEPQRIAKLLARAGIASRREIERMIVDRRIALDGVPIETPATLLLTLRGITVDGNPVAAPAPARLFRFHKPAGVLTAERDPKGRRTIYDVLPGGLPRVIPVGRLDLNTEGLLLLTTDGELKRQLELPATQVKRTYRARAFGEVSQAQLEDLIDGIEIEGVRYGSIDANLERRTGANVWIEMTLAEGKNREVRRVLEHLGLQVGRLIRTRYGPIGLDDMAVGAVDEVRQHDLIQFRRELRLPADKRSNAPLVTRATKSDRNGEEDTDASAPVSSGERRRSGAPPLRSDRPVAAGRNAKPPRRPASAQTERREGNPRAPVREEIATFSRDRRRAGPSHAAAAGRDAKPARRPASGQSERREGNPRAPVREEIATSPRDRRRAGPSHAAAGRDAKPARRPASGQAERREGNPRASRREEIATSPQELRRAGPSRSKPERTRSPREDAERPKRDRAAPSGRTDTRPPRRPGRGDDAPSSPAGPGKPRPPGGNRPRGARPGGNPRKGPR